MKPAKQVPWRDWIEWRSVYVNVISSGSIDRARAVSGIKQWKSRCKLPIAVEATATILEIFLIDPFFTHISDQSSDRSCSELALMYGHALARFVNLITDLAQKGMVAASMDSLAVSVDIPSWVVQVRHAAAHGSVFPPLSILRRGALELMDGFIVPKYWECQNQLCKELPHSPDISTTSTAHPGFELWKLKQYFADEHCSVSVMQSVDMFGGPFLHWVSTSLGGKDHTMTKLEEAKFLTLFDSLPTPSVQMDLIHRLITYGNHALIASLIRNDRSSYSIKFTILEHCAHCDFTDAQMLLAILDSFSPSHPSSSPEPATRQTGSSVRLAGRPFSQDTSTARSLVIC